MTSLNQTPEFVTATILDWKPLLKPDKYKVLLLESLQFLVRDNRILLNSYVIMDNHIHLIWQMLNNRKSSDVRRDFFKYTAHQIQVDLRKNHPKVLPHFESTRKDRRYQFWERKSLCVDLFSDQIFEQKLNYIHANPVKAGLCTLESDYEFSSAKFYTNGYDPYNMLTEYKSLERLGE